MRRVLFGLSFVVVTLFQPMQTEAREFIEGEGVICVFEESLRYAAQEVLSMYEGIKGELEEALGMKLNMRPTVLLVKDRALFQKLSGSVLFVAFALPERKLIVIDYTKMNTHPFTLGITLKHELSHLLLYEEIGSAGLPKWLDEGIAQWLSNGIAEILMNSRRSPLDAAMLSGNYLSLNRLEVAFPREERALILAYEESKSVVAYINEHFGRDAILDILEHLKDGQELGEAILNSLSISLRELESRWHSHLRERTAWLPFLANNLYGMLFFLAALITIGGFIRVVVKRRRYEDDEFSS